MEFALDYAFSIVLLYIRERSGLTGLSIPKLDIKPAYFDAV
jgi:hypothetical protein